MIFIIIKWSKSKFEKKGSKTVLLLFFFPFLFFLFKREKEKKKLFLYCRIHLVRCEKENILFCPKLCPSPQVRSLISSHSRRWHWGVIGWIVDHQRHAQNWRSQLSSEREWLFQSSQETLTWGCVSGSFGPQISFFTHNLPHTNPFPNHIHLPCQMSNPCCSCFSTRTAIQLPWFTVTCSYCCWNHHPPSSIHFTQSANISYFYFLFFFAPFAFSSCRYSILCCFGCFLWLCSCCWFLFRATEQPEAVPCRSFSGTCDILWVTVWAVWSGHVGRDGLAAAEASRGTRSVAAPPQDDPTTIPSTPSQTLTHPIHPSPITHPAHTPPPNNKFY